MIYPEVSHQVKSIPVTLITTLYNEENSLEEYLSSLISMTVLPKEFVIVDGGSTDKTVSILEAFKSKYDSTLSVVIIIDPFCSIKHTPAPIAMGRNIAVRNAHHNVIAATDAGCIVDPHWLEKITDPFFDESDVQMVAGWYEPLPKNYFEECQSLAIFRSSESVNPGSFLPSSRSVAFTKWVWEQVGGYPELSLTGEDTLFGLRVKMVTKKIVIKKDAVVYWRLRPNISVFTKMVYRYGFGDGYNKILFGNVIKNIVKILILLLLLILSISSWIYLFAAIVYAWLLPFNGKIREAFRIKHLYKYPTVSMLKLLQNIVYLIGYIIGYFTIQHPAFEKMRDHQS